VEEFHFYDTPVSGRIPSRHGLALRQCSSGSRPTVSAPSFAIAVTMLPRIALAQSELVGTWKLKVEISKFNPGPAPKKRIDL